MTMMTQTERSSLWPPLITVVGVLLLLALGTWQMQRLFEKNALIQRIEAQMASPPVPLPRSAIDPATWEYRKVNLVGTFLHDSEIHLATIGANGRPGYRLITPLLRNDGLPVLVNRGWVPQALKEPAARPSSQPVGIVHLEGQVAGIRPKSRFTPANDLPGNVWYYADLEEMALATGLGDHMPVMIMARAPADSGAYPGDYPQISPAMRMPPNNHLVYVITWYALALGLAGVFLIYRRGQRG